MTPGRERMLFDCPAYPFCSNQRLRIISIQKKRGKLFTTKERRHVSRSECSFDDHANILECSASDHVTILVIHSLKVIEIHHQDTERRRFLLSARCFPSQLREERLAGQKPGQLVMGNEPMNLLLKLSIDLVKQLEAKEMVSDENLV